MIFYVKYPICLYIMIPNLSSVHPLDATTLVQLMSKGCGAQCLQHHGIGLHISLLLFYMWYDFEGWKLRALEYDLWDTTFRTRALESELWKKQTTRVISSQDSL